MLHGPLNVTRQPALSPPLAQATMTATGSTGSMAPLVRVFYRLGRGRTERMLYLMRDRDRRPGQDEPAWGGTCAPGALPTLERLAVGLNIPRILGSPLSAGSAPERQGQSVPR